MNPKMKMALIGAACFLAGLAVAALGGHCAGLGA